MQLSQVNHVITEVKGMLGELIQGGILTGEQALTLLPVLVIHAIRNDRIEIEDE